MKLVSGGVTCLHWFGGRFLLPQPASHHAQAWWSPWKGTGGRALFSVRLSHFKLPDGGL